MNNNTRTEIKLISLEKKIQRQRKILKENFKVESELAEKIPGSRVIFPPTSILNKNNLFDAMGWGHNGFILQLDECRMIIDPGYDFLARCASANINLYTCNSIFISHAHVDHYSSVNVCIEAMSFFDHSKQIDLLASAKTLTDRAVSDYHSNRKKQGLKNVHAATLHSGETITIKNVHFIPIKMYHSIPGTMGFIAEYRGTRIGYISDTGYTQTFSTHNGKVFQAGEEKFNNRFCKIEKTIIPLKKYFSNMDLLIVNINSLNFNRHSKYHLTGYDLINILSENNVKSCIITHLNTSSDKYIRFNKLLASFITDMTNIPTKTLPVDGITVIL